MSEVKTPRMVIIDNVEYDANTFNEKQVLLFNHCLDLDRKISSANFELQQLQVGKESFFSLLKEALVVKKPPEGKNLSIDVTDSIATADKMSC